MKETLPFLAILAIAPIAPGQVIFVEQMKLTASEGAGQFGNTVSLSGDRALVGEWGAEAAYVFVRNGSTWTEEAKLTVPDPSQFGVFFGESVSLSGDRALVGAPGNFGEEGKAYVFVRNESGWVTEDRLVASDSAVLDNFGGSVSLSGDTALVGAFGADGAYVFVRNGSSWTEEAKLQASPWIPNDHDHFGASVSLDGDTALVGAPGTSQKGLLGNAYVFVRSGTTWTQQAKLTPAEGFPDDQFGAAVSISNDAALVGAPGVQVDAVIGQAHVFVRSGTTWMEEAKLTASDGEPQNIFGGAVSLSDNVAIVGAVLDDHNGPDAGSAYVFVRTGADWMEKQILTPGDAQAGDRFGSSVSISGHTVLVGAELDDDNGTDRGSAYIFVPPEPSIYCTAGVSASGCQALLSAAGIASATDATGFTLSAATVEGQKDGLFYLGTNGQQANPWGNGTSYQCVVPPVVRAPTMTGVGTIGLCDGSFALDLNALWCPTCPKPAKNPGPGATVQAQLWYRDPASTSNQTTSLSDAIEFGVAP